MLRLTFVAVREDMSFTFVGVAMAIGFDATRSTMSTRLKPDGEIMAQSRGLENLLPVLADIWEGVDEEFARYVQSAFGVPSSLTTKVSITRPATSGRSAVSIGNDWGSDRGRALPRTKAHENQPIRYRAHDC